MSTSKSELYETLLAQLRGLLADERDLLAGAANTAALLFDLLPEVSWAGFYFYRGGDLVLGPFQGKPACTRIAPGKGVCGAAAGQRKTVVVPDVRRFPGHIACDPASRSEIVVPLVRDDRLLGVLDLDSPVEGRFDDEDARGLEAVAELLLERTGPSPFALEPGPTPAGVEPLEQRPTGAPADAAKVTLSDVIAAMEFQSDESRAYFDRRSGRVLHISDEALRAAEGDEIYEDDEIDKIDEDAEGDEGDDDLSNWQQEEVLWARELLAEEESGRFVALPDKFEINEYGLMEKFGWTVADPAAAEQIARAIRGRGSFRRFKDLVHRLGLADRWYQFRDEAIRQVAVDWCQGEEIDYTEE